VELIAYEGEKFSIEWYFDLNSKSDALEYFNELPQEFQVKALALFKRFSDFGEIKDKTKFNFEGDGIFAFKPIPHRFLCFFVKGKKVIITNAFIKKSDKMPKSEKERALKRKEDYETRTKKEQYY
jgi:phage-related protein